MHSSQIKSSGKGGRLVLWRCMIGIWLLLVAGLPVYYLRPERDWYYSSWGSPQEILTSGRLADNPLYKDEGVYSRVFIVRPSEENLAYLDSLEYKHCIFSESVEPLLKECGLPGPYRFANTGCVNFVLCGDGLMLVHDFSRNKGGLFSSRLAYPEDVVRLYPFRFVFYYIWAWISIGVLVISPGVFLLGKGIHFLCRDLGFCARRADGAGK